MPMFPKLEFLIFLLFFLLNFEQIFYVPIIIVQKNINCLIFNVFIVNYSIEFFTVKDLLFLDSQQIPNSSSKNVDIRKNQDEYVAFSSKGSIDNLSRNSEHPNNSHYEIYNNNYVICCRW